MKHLRLVLLCLLGPALGCVSPYETRTYQVTVKNYAAAPVTVWLTKDGPPFEPGWLSPEDLATESPRQSGRVISGLVIPSTKTAYTGARKGRFEPNTHAVLRVYAGQLTFAQLLAFDSDDKHRIDFLLHQGDNDLIITGDSDTIQIKEAEPAASP